MSRWVNVKATAMATGIARYVLIVNVSVLILGNLSEIPLSALSDLVPVYPSLYT